MDLTKLSDSDLVALQSGDLTKLSDEGLNYLSNQPLPVKSKTSNDGLGQDLGNLAAGALRGAGSIGSTLLSLAEFTPQGVFRNLMTGQSLNPFARERNLSNLITGKETLSRDEARRAAIEEGLRTMGAQPESGLYKTGKISAEIAGTMGAGGTLAKGLTALAPSAATKVPYLVEALRTSGMSGGGLVPRTIGGAISGATQAGMVNPEQAGIGAAIGGGLPLAGGAIRGSGTLARKFLGGTTGVGDEALVQALRAGREGGKTAEAFTKAMRGQSSMDDALIMAKQNLDVMGQQKQAAYRTGMEGIKADKTVLDLSNIDNAVDDAMKMATYKGQIKNERAADALSRIKNEIDNWRSLDPAEFHTPEGLDALKQKIGGIVEEIPFEQKTANAAASKVYNAIKSEINNQAPEYSKVMKGYSEASDTIKEIERSLSLGKKSAADTSMRKLQTLMRNNVNTGYGYRQKLAEQLQQAGGQDFMPALAGQSLSDVLPRGMQRALSGTGGAGLAFTGNLPAAAGVAAISSPRLVGESLYGLGKLQGKVNPELIKALRENIYLTSPVAGSQ